ncbi:unnamed protein product [Fraxinus pennsylvanica]|uniref:Uncharacterized protein n=1 Tax=Fraxinus pennsylvanica TaxID=56036 RepID=A0AAD2DUS4_9LAMI|nr:unnamed protein product [Fraxinus pennsylvanica]
MPTENLSVCVYVEKKSSGSLDPWDIPGTPDFDSCDYSQQSPSTDRIVKVEKIDRLNMKLMILRRKNVVVTGRIGPATVMHLDQNDKKMCNGGMGNVSFAKGSKMHKNNNSNVEVSDDDDFASLNIGLPGFASL